MSVTIKDVAKLAGVATSTVSRTVKDHPSISSATKEKVKQAMDELGYVPNYSAQSLARKSTCNIGIILPPFSDEDRISDPFFMKLISVIDGVCNKKGYIVSIASGKNYDELLASVKIMYQHKRVDGFILLYSIVNDVVIDFLHESKVPFVLVGTPYKYENETVYVDNDNIVLGKTATNYLIQKGHKEIFFVGSENEERVHRERYEGYFLAMQGNNCKPSSFYRITDPIVYMDFIEDVERNKPTAVIAVDDLFALKLIQVLSQYNYHIGDNISMISFNNSFFSTMYHPYLTTVDIHVRHLANEAISALFALLENANRPRTKIIVPHEVVARETVVDLKK